MGFRDKAKELFNKAKEKTYKGIANIEKNIDEKGVLKGLGASAEEGLESIVEKSKDVHKSVQEKGGYLKVAQDGLNQAVDKMNSYYDSAKDKLFTDGKYDPVKGKQFFSDGADSVKKYGKKASETLATLVKDTSSKIKTDYRDLVPTKEERETKYAGIGAKYDGMLFRQNYEACLTFYNVAESVIPKDAATRDALLEDIKASASVNIDELKAFYADPKHNNDSLLGAVKQYLS